MILRLEGYDNDRKFPVYGFGAKFNKELSHAYPLNNNRDDVRELKLYLFFIELAWWFLLLSYNIQLFNLTLIYLA